MVLPVLRGQGNRLQGGRDIPTQKIEVDFNLLRGVLAAFAGAFMNKDFLCKLVEHGICQCVEILILVNQGYKLLRRFPALLIAGNGLFQFRDFRIEGFLLFGVLCVQGLIPGVRQLAQGVVLIDFANQLFQFLGPLLGGGQPFPLLGYIGGLLGGLRFLDGADKLGPVIFRILRDGPEHIGYQGQDSLGPDAVLCAAERPAWDFGVLAASKLWVTLAVIDAMDIHLAAAVGTVHQAGQRVGLAPAVRVTPDICPDTLHIVKGFLVDDGLMGVLENRPLIFVNIVAFLVLEVPAGLEIDGVASGIPAFSGCSQWWTIPSRRGL